MVFRKTRSVSVPNQLIFVIYRIRKKNLWLVNFLNLKLNTRLPTKKIGKLDVNAFREEGKQI